MVKIFSLSVQNIFSPSTFLTQMLHPGFSNLFLLRPRPLLCLALLPNELNLDLILLILHSSLVLFIQSFLIGDGQMDGSLLLKNQA